MFWNKHTHIFHFFFLCTGGRGWGHLPQMWFLELTDQERPKLELWGLGSVAFLCIARAHVSFMVGTCHECCLYCAFYRTKWLLLLEEVLGEPGSLGHFMSTALAQTEDSTLLFCPFLWVKSSPGWTKYSSSGAVKADTGGTSGTDILTARLPGSMVSYV